MILVFGGTTEGRLAAKELEEAGSPFWYSTRGGEQHLDLHHGVAISGAMDRDQMTDFCNSHQIRLIIDAAHPFASELHSNISKLGIPVIRFERIYPERDRRIIWCNDFADAVQKMKGTNRLLSTAGVQSIPKLRPLEESGTEIFHRILDRESSRELAAQYVTDPNHLCFYHPDVDETEEINRVNPDAILLKESGVSGGYENKTEAALNKGIKVFAIARPKLPESFITVNGPYGMRRMVEKLLPEFYPLHSGLTTGSCAAAAALAAAQSLIDGKSPNIVNLLLPDGETIPVETTVIDKGRAYVIKDSGDDPDVTDKMEIHAQVEKLDSSDIVIDGGDGVGRITLPGFDFPPGEAAINKAPRQMIKDNLNKRYPNRGFRVIISVPGGEEIAHRTFNPRLGIEGGISIIGVSGIIKPFSEEGFINSIRKCMEVAKASGEKRVVINSGAKSENYLKDFYPALPAQCFVQYGNKIGDAISIAYELGFRQITLGIMLGKAVKLAAGNLDTHSSNVTMDRDFISELLQSINCPKEISDRAYSITLARELWEIIPENLLQGFANEVKSRCKTVCGPLCPEANLTVLLIDDNGNIK
ncbi:MAG: cobalamin biosynthesis protein CbiD [Bacteroidales bacterium]|nr:cobalamin biosynthesis protein CbiD [Bacteroidales bacterium]